MIEKTINDVKINYYDCLESTNLTAMNLSEPDDYLTVIADTQTGGRGRSGRSFYSYDGGLYMSIILNPSKLKVPYSLITPSSAVAVRNVLTENGVEGLSIKWVNDILQNGKKVCGILTEAKTLNNKIERIVIGIGINLNEHSLFPKEIENKAKSLNVNLNKSVLATQITKKIKKYLEGNKEDIILEYSNSLAFLNEEIEATDYSNNNTKIKGTVLGVTELGFLKLELADKSIKILSSGEII